MKGKKDYFVFVLFVCFGLIIVSMIVLEMASDYFWKKKKKIGERIFHSVIFEVTRLAYFSIDSKFKIIKLYISNIATQKFKSRVMDNATWPMPLFLCIIL